MKSALVAVVLGLLLGVAWGAAEPPAKNAVTLSGTVQFVEPLSPVSCLARLRIGVEPEAVLDIQGEGAAACGRLLEREGRRVAVAGRCAPLFTVYGSLCRPVAERVR